MTWEQKLQALNALAECRLIMREPGRWYVNQHIEIKDGGVLGSVSGNGENPIEAVNSHWDKVTNLPDRQYIVCNAYGGQRTAFRWAGFMWRAVDEPATRTDEVTA
jgi:hypothetical protein